MISHEYLHFVQVPMPADRKTEVWDVVSNHSGDTLGQIRWFGRWRQYCFYPASHTIWNPGCLEAVNAVIASLMAKRQASVG